MNLLLQTGWKLSGTKSFRLSSTKLLSMWGGNAQNPDPRLMRNVIAGDGNIFVQADQKGAEAVVVAYLAKPGRMRRLIEAGIKPHTYLALHLFIEKFTLATGTDKSRWWMKDASELLADPLWPTLNRLISKDSPQEYALGKLTCHAKNYDMKWRTFQLNVLDKSDGTIVLTPTQAKDFLKMFDLLFPEIIEWQNETIAFTRSSGVLRNLFGHPRRFDQVWRSDYERQALAQIPQSTVGELTVIASTEIYQELQRTGENRIISLANNKHDSLMLKGPSGEQERMTYLLKSSMAKSFTTPRGQFTMGIDVSVGKNWAKYDKLTNPEGMREL